MGKLEKRIKSDRINALKKKYDAYLEEDRKRKERNEYILEKLDKMRCCNALAQVRKKSSNIDESCKVALNTVPTQSFQSTSCRPIDSTSINIRDSLPETHNNTDETIILQEISKKYILIPKLRYMQSNDYIQYAKPQIDESNDWKSKYDILAQLKKNEKEDLETEPHTAYMLNTLVTKDEDGNKSKTEQFECDKTRQRVNEQIQNYNHDNNYNEKINIERAEIKVDSPNKKADDIVNENYRYDISHSEVTQKESYNEFKKNVVPHENSNTGNLSNTDNNIIQDATEFDTVADYGTNDIPNEYSSVAISNTQEYNTSEDVKQSSSISDHYELKEGNSTEAITSNAFMVDGNSTNTIEQHEYPIEIINSQEFAPRYDGCDEEKLSTNPEEQLMKDSDYSSNFNNEVVAMAPDNTEETDNIFDPVVISEDTVPVETTGIETFTENKDEYYNEQATDNYMYNEVTDNYNTEYSAPNENYSQQEYDAYYEGVQTEAPYAIETNEDEAALQQYDQNYQQQYDTDHNNPQDYQQYVEQGYEQNEYTEQPEVDLTQQYDNQDDTLQHVEQVLDNEQGYIVEKQNELIETSNAEKAVALEPATDKIIEKHVKAQ
ncbi:unnamed protein product [Diatraea saccharalis]|uniref:Uncharacterized protein n=1 Tax=Diatraea saccharalis TaxID=40085 RepID=A0A9N9R4D4_9NEOP|nr:unnamed protein product [Diatraea saccharalis]